MLHEVDGLALTKHSSASRSHKLPNAEFWVDMKPEPQARRPLPPHKMKLRRKMKCLDGRIVRFLAVAATIANLAGRSVLCYS